MRVDMRAERARLGGADLGGCRGAVTTERRRVFDVHAAYGAPELKWERFIEGAKPFLNWGFLVELTTTCKDDGANARSGRRWVLVFPHAHAQPPRLVELRVGVAVTCNVALHLVGPESSVRHCDRVVLGAPVPETPIQKDGHALLRKHKIGGAAYVAERSSRNAVTKSERMDGRPERKFGLGVPSAVRLHACACSG